MVRYENDCVDCGLPCLGDTCQYRHVKHLYCDNCKCEAEKLYVLDSDELCFDCFMKDVEVIE